MNPWKGKHGPLLIAEIGGNHEGNFEYAKKLNQLAIDSGADYVKYQIYTGDSLVNPVEGPQRNKHFKKFELTQEQHIQLAESCRTQGVGYMASVWDVEALDWIDDYMNIYKIGSGDLTAYSVLKQTTAREKPIILSTGLAKEEEVLASVRFIQEQNEKFKSSNMLSVLQCTSMYPIPFSDAHLNVMQRLAALTGLPVGYSDHTEGALALETAVAMGAQILEFHFTDDRSGKSFRDHKVSLTRDEVKLLTERIQAIRELQGDSTKRPLTVEGDHVTTFRRAIYPAMDIPAGTKITDEHLVNLRPNHGIGAENYERILGKVTLVALRKHQQLAWSHFSE